MVAVFGERYSAKQIELIKLALRTYKEREYRDGKKITWAKFSGEAFLKVDFDMDDDRFRKFVIAPPASDDDPDSFKDIPLPERLRVIADFVTDPENKLLTPKDLELAYSHSTFTYAPLMEFLYRGRTGIERRIDLFSGLYRVKYVLDGQLVVTDLRVIARPDSDAADVFKLTRTYATATRDEKALLGTLEEPPASFVLKVARRMEGWGILTPEDSLVAFVRDGAIGNTETLLSIGTDLSRFNDQPVRSLCILCHAWPEEIDGLPKHSEEAVLDIMSSVSEAAYYFTFIGEATESKDQIEVKKKKRPSKKRDKGEALEEHQEARRPPKLEPRSFSGDPRQFEKALDRHAPVISPSQREQIREDLSRMPIEATAKALRKDALGGNEVSVDRFAVSPEIVNGRDSALGATALHLAAGNSARGVVRVLIRSGHCDYLLRDHHGRLASEWAYLFGKDVAVYRLLRIKERKQAAERGGDCGLRPS